jgi:RNA polymerase sigma-70 factor (ECF subfamily)
MNDHSAHSDARITELALAAGRGDRRALEQFIAETQQDVWRFIAHRTSPGRADDLTQETYLRSLGSLARFEGRSSARTWLLSIARRVCVDEVRAALSRPRVTQTVDWEAEADRARGERAGADDHALEFVEVKLMLAELSDDRREALILTQVLGLSYSEAAAVCGCPVGTVRSRVARAREDLVNASWAAADRAVGADGPRRPRGPRR